MPAKKRTSSPKKTLSKTIVKKTVAPVKVSAGWGPGPVGFILGGGVLLLAFFMFIGLNFQNEMKQGFMEGYNESKNRREAMEATPEVAQQPFVSNEGHFEIQFPGEPTKTEAKFPGNNVPYTQYNYVDSQGREYFVQFSTFPELLLGGQSDRQTLQQAIAGLESGLQGKVTDSQFSTFLDHTSVDVSMIYGGKFHIKLRMFMVDTTLYVIANTDTEEQVKDFEGFVNSFKLRE